MKFARFFFAYSLTASSLFAQQFAAIAPATDAMLFDESLDHEAYFVQEHTFLAWEKAPAQEQFVSKEAAMAYCNTVTWGDLAWHMASTMQLRTLFSRPSNVAPRRYLGRDTPVWDGKMLLGFDALEGTIIPLEASEEGFYALCCASIE